MSLRLAVLISLIAGFVSISMEIIWFSIIGYLIKGHAGIFGIVLALILFGIALGTKLGYKAINKPNTNVVELISNVLLVTAAFNFFAFPLIAWLMTFHMAFSVLIIFNIVSISGMLGCVFPLLCHLTVSSTENKVGKQTSLLYAANIIGATAGPLLTGYVLIDNFKMHSIITVLCIILIFIAMLLRFNSLSFKLNTKYIAICLVFIAVVGLSRNYVYANFLEHIHYNAEFNDEKKFKYILQSKSGIISVDQNDVFYGGGAFDGSVNTNPLNFVNHIERTYMVAALHPAPKKVLMIGLSTGSWAKILSDYSQIEELTIIEINPGYIELIKKYPEVSGILKNKKVTIIIDDGRRWLKKNSDKMYDLIVMNTTYYWRENCTNLLSQEFIKLCKSTLKPKGVMYWNTTGSPEVVYTAANTFAHVTKYQRFVAASDSPFNLSNEEKKNNFLKFIRDGDTLFAQNNTAGLLNEMINANLTDIRDSILKENLWLITDNNMATEYKAGVWHKPLFLK